MDGFPVFLSRWIPYEYDRLLDGSGFEYLPVCTLGTPLLISGGGANRVLEDLCPDIPRNQFFGKVAEAKYVQHVKLGWFKFFPDIQDHLGEVQPQRHQGVGQEQGLPQRENFWKNSWNLPIIS